MARAKGRKHGRPIAIDLFCGAGGMSLGFEQAGFDVLLGVEMDGHHAAVHERNFPHAKLLRTSVVSLTAADLYAELGGQHEVDLVFGGPPCQGFSHMGLRDVEDPRNTLVDHFARLVAELRPKAFVMENVPGMQSGDTRPILARVVGLLEIAGYNMTMPLRVLDASEFGVPQKRKRLFLLGVRQDVADSIPYPARPCPGQPPRPTVWEAIADLPGVEECEELFRSDETAYDRQPETDYAKVARGVLDDPSDFSYPREWRRDRCTGCLRIRHAAKALELYAATPPGQAVPGHKLPRLDPNGICPTLRAGSDSTHGSYTAPRPIHPFQPRCITAREAARLHGFPDWFAFYPLKWHAYRQIGNAVCPPVARAVGSEIVRILSHTPTKPGEVLRLSEDFELPEDRPRTLRRIPQILNYPPVVRHLFERAYDEKAGRLWRGRFTFGDVQEAIAATGVNLFWTRADTFLQEIARSRNIRQILEPCLVHGYSIRPVSCREFIGEFVPAGEPGTVDDKDAIHVRSRDVAGAILGAPAEPVVAHDPLSLSTLLAEEVVVASLWGERRLRVEVGPLAARDGSGHSASYQVRNGKVIVGHGCLLVSPPGTVLTKAKIGRFAKAAEAAEVLVFVPVTARHILAIRFEGCMDSPREACRKVYEIAGGPGASLFEEGGQ